MDARRILCLHLGQDDRTLRNLLNQSSWQVDVALDFDRARRLLERNTHRVGLAVFNEFSDRHWEEAEAFFAERDEIEWVAISDEQSLQTQRLRDLIRHHFYDYHTPPLDHSRLLTILGHAHGMALLRSSADKESPGEEQQMVGSSPVMLDVFRDIRKVAAVDAPVLLTGESGTGKELAALAIHERSSRRDGPFVVMNCAALPESLIQSELFGYEKGAFTGAAKRKIGHIEAAQGGTIFLDEIGDLPLPQQGNLLRFLQEQSIERLGGTQSVHVNVRTIAATNADLDTAVAVGGFRSDLYYRLNVLQLEMPAVRKRIGDVELLARYYFDKFSNERNQRLRGFSRQALVAMNQHSWPGNVRELINRVRRALVMCDKRLITPECLGLELKMDMASSPIANLTEIRDRAECEALQASMRMSRNNISQAARQLGVSRVTLYRLLEKHDLSCS